MTDPVAPAAPAAAPVTAAAALIPAPAAAVAPVVAPVVAPAAALVATAETDAALAAAAAESPAIKMPGKDATPEDWSAFYNQIGRPETAAAYELPVPEGDDGTFAAEIAPMLHKNGLTSDQAKGLAADWNTYMGKLQADADAAQVAQATAANVKNTAEATALQSEWGQAHPANMELARRAVQQFMPGDKAAPAIAALEGVLGYKGTIQFLHGIGKGLGEGDAAGMGSNNTGAAPKTLAERMYPNMKP